MSETVIEASSLSKQYLKQKALDDVSFRITRGMICGLIGPNGSGKTTVMKLLGGLVVPTGGEIALFGGKDEKSLCEARKRMSFMIEAPYVKEGFTARENLEKQRIQRGIPDRECVDRALERVGLSDTGKKPVKAFSLGMRQRIGIANALLTTPEIMVLDEPINGLDPEGIVEIRELLLKLNREEHITIVISSHILSELSLLCTDFIFINKGKVLRALSAGELKGLCEKYYLIHTDNDEKARTILRERLGITRQEQNADGSIRLYERLDDLREVSKALYDNGVIPLELRTVETDLEEYYLKMLGGEQLGEHIRSDELSGGKG